MNRAWVFLLVFLAGCSVGERLLKDGRAEPATAHERYARALIDAGLDSTALGAEWLAASDSALRAPLSAPLPAREVGVYTRHEARAVAYRVALRRGQQLQAAVRVTGLPARLYVDVFAVTADTARPFVHRATADTLVVRDSAGFTMTLAYEADDDGDYVVRLQPELLRSGQFELTLESAPGMVFPVQGSTNRAIQSLFGVERDGGRRAHHGIDIFAPRGTPVLAATDGVVRSISPNNLGGNVVWLLDERRRQSLYYAHLESHHVVAGQRVSAGDTLGFVGNSGNARTTAPHLHFGIYKRGMGPIDPLWFVRLTTADPPRVVADTSRLGGSAVTRVAGVTLRQGPRTDSPAVRELPRDTRLQIMGASAQWYRVQFEDGTTGYLTAAAVRSVDE